MTEDAPQPTWRRASRDVGLAAVAVVAVVLGAAVLTGVLPESLQRVVFHTPLAIGVLVIGTAWVLYRIARPGRSGRASERQHPGQPQPEQPPE